MKVWEWIKAAYHSLVNTFGGVLFYILFVFLAITLVFVTLICILRRQRNKQCRIDDRRLGLDKLERGELQPDHNEHPLPPIPSTSTPPHEPSPPQITVLSGEEFYEANEDVKY